MARNRKDFVNGCPGEEEGAHDYLKEVLDEIENRVNLIKDLLENIKGVRDLGQAEDAMRELDDLSEDLY